MRETLDWRRGCGLASIAASFLFALLAAGCSGGMFGGPPPTSEAAPGTTGSSSFSNFFSGSSAKGPQTVANAQPDLNCPPVDIRQGASTLQIGPNGGKGSAMALKYQVAFARQARECSIVNGVMAMRIGVEGRVVVGPAGGPGQVDVPLRMAVVQETPGGARPITTKFIRIPVTIGASDGNVIFTHIEDGINFPVPAPASALDDYIVYIGFDPLSLQAQDQKLAPAPKTPKTQKLRNRPSASVN